MAGASTDRPGENDYLLNRQRVRLKDLVDLLDAAHLADNAFLFIGQGMVDQALALRPEERRPLFEEVAGVRRHERRKKRSEEQLVESTANLARLEDILAEDLRPQARRLAVQAEQQASRQTAGEELVDALLLAAHARWHEAAARVAQAAALRARTRLAADRAMAELPRPRSASWPSPASWPSGRPRSASGGRSTGGYGREEWGDCPAGRLAAEGEALGRDRVRLAGERAVVVADLDAHRRAMAAPDAAQRYRSRGSPGRCGAIAGGGCRAELAVLRAADRARGEELAAVQRAEAARATELETARRRVAEAERRAAAESGSSR